MTFFKHWGQHFFKYYPSPPVEIIIQVENAIKDSDIEMYSYLKANKIQLGGFVWQNLVNLYTDIMTKDQWLTLFDYLVAYSEYPELFCLVLAAEFILNRNALLSCVGPEEFNRFFKDLRTKSVTKTLKKAFELLETCLNRSGFALEFVNAVPLTAGSYQPFKFLPTLLRIEDLYSFSGLGKPEIVPVE